MNLIYFLLGIVDALVVLMVDSMTSAKSDNEYLTYLSFFLVKSISEYLTNKDFCFHILLIIEGLIFCEDEFFGISLHSFCVILIQDKYFLMELLELYDSSIYVLDIKRRKFQLYCKPLLDNFCCRFLRFAILLFSDLNISV